MLGEIEQEKNSEKASVLSQLSYSSVTNKFYAHTVTKKYIVVDKF